MGKRTRGLHDLLVKGDLPAVLAETEHTAGLIAPDFDAALFHSVVTDITRLFYGKYPGYQASNTAYHDLDHTALVTLAMARLLHGLVLQGNRFSARQTIQGLCSALFHDTGLIQEEDDTEGTGAKYTIGHEDRSIALMSTYLEGQGFSAQEIEECGQIVRCTILSLPPARISFSNQTVALLGKAMGTVDLLAQMADRNYLEKLSSLFKEFEEGGISGYKSELELLKKTEQFHHSVVKVRLVEDLDNVGLAMLDHFRARWNIDRDLYAEAIAANIAYLNSIEDVCDDISCWYETHLRRGGLIKGFMQKEK